MVVVILDLTSGSLTQFAKKCYVLHCNAAMKVTNQKKGIFSFYTHNMNKTISLRAISIRVDFIFRLKVLIINIIRWRSISMRAGPAFSQFDWSKAGLGMDLPVFVYSHTKTSFKFLSRQGRYRAAFYVVGDLLLQSTQREPYRALVLSRRKSVKVY